MKLSIIIVNYNVRFFLEQCLNSVYKATQNINAEIFVVDNNSPDDSVEMVKEKFPQATLIHNTKNVGFSRANNQAIEISKGEYILLLNPDTVVEEDTFEKCITFMDAHPNAGGLGVKMIDGSGTFLPESKRGLPTPSVSFYKIFGFSKLFPKSKIFAKYHLGHLKENETNEIEVLSGAFMWMRKSVLEEVGYLDNAFFMYGEDIDLSYRITLAGYQNFYFPEAKIIHYKGESTKKGNINYVFVFYNAMIIFSKKHFAKKAKAFSFFINIAIYLRAFMAILFRFISSIMLPLIDVFIISTILIILNYLKPSFGFPNQFELTHDYEFLNISAVFLSFIVGLILSGGYSKTISLKKTSVGLIIGGSALYLINLLFPEASSFSNKYIASIIFSTLIIIPIVRILLDYFNKIKLRRSKVKATIIAGSSSFISQIKAELEQKQLKRKILNVKENNLSSNTDKDQYIGKLYQLPDLIAIYNINEVIFSSSDISYKDMIAEMSLTKNKNVDYKISLNSNLIIGSQTIEKINLS